MKYIERHNGIERIITESQYNEKITRYKEHVKKHRLYWTDDSKFFILISMTFANQKVIDVRAFETKQELDIYTADCVCCNVAYI